MVRGLVIALGACFDRCQRLADYVEPPIRPPGAAVRLGKQHSEENTSGANASPLQTSQLRTEVVKVRARAAPEVGEEPGAYCKEREDPVLIAEAQHFGRPLA